MTGNPWGLVLAVVAAVLVGSLWARWVIRGGSATTDGGGTWLGALEFGSRRLLVRFLSDPADRWFHWGLQAHHPAQARACLEEAARLGHADAHFELGLFFEQSGLGPGGGLVATGHYRRAASQGHGEAAFRLAECLRWGIGSERRPQEAHRWYLQSAQRGFGPAMVWLATAYAQGDGVPPDEVEAERWRARLADLEVMPSLRTSVVVQGSPTGDPLVQAGRELRAAWDEKLVEVAPTEAFRHYARFSALLVIALAIGGVGFLLFLALFGPFAPAAVIALAGLGLLHLKLRRSVRWSRTHLRLEADARRGAPEACFRLGMAYLRGAHPLPRDPVAAREWLERAADGGHVEAMAQLGELLTWDLAGPRDPQAAERWLGRAAQAGHVGARARLDQRSTSVETENQGEEP